MTVNPVQIDLGYNLGYSSCHQRLDSLDRYYDQLSVTCPGVDVMAPLPGPYDCIGGVCTPIPNGPFFTYEDCLNSGCAPPPPPVAEAGMGAGLALLAGLFFLAMIGKKRAP